MAGGQRVRCATVADALNPINSKGVEWFDERLWADKKWHDLTVRQRALAVCAVLVVMLLVALFSYWFFTLPWFHSLVDW